MRVAKFNVMCYAIYQSELEIPDDLETDDETLLDYIRENLSEAPVLDIEFLEDIYDTCTAVTEEDLRGVY